MKIALPLIMLLLVSCSGKEQKPAKKPVNSRKPGQQQAVVDSEVVMDNKFTRIVSNLCDKVEFSELQYTNKNTEIIPLDIRNSFDCFLFASEISCGFPAGTCGDDIQVIQKHAGGYHEVFSACGYVYNALSETNNGIKSFIYGTSDGYKIKVSWTGSKFSEEPIAINGLNYNSIRQIARITDITESNFIPDDPQNDDLLHTRVRTEPVDIGREKTLTLYTVMLDQEPEFFLFDATNGNTQSRMLLHTTAISAIQAIPDFSKDYPDIVTTASQATVVKNRKTFRTQTWRYDRHQKIYKPAKGRK